MECRVWRRALGVVFSLVFGLAHGAPAWAGQTRDLAKALSAGAERAGLRRVAVLPFQGVGGQAAPEGWVVCEQLTTELVRLGRVQAVERNLISKLLEEQRLARTGALEARGRLGALSTVEGIVTGSVAKTPSGWRVEARLIDAASGWIIAADREELPSLLDSPIKEARTPLWAEEYPQPAKPEPAPLPALPVQLPGFASAAPAPVLPARADVLPAAARPAPVSGCAQAEEASDTLESWIVDLKARYWALRLRMDGRQARAQSLGTPITDPELADRFRQDLRSWSSRQFIPTLSADELQTLLGIERQAAALRRDCSRLAAL